MEKPHRPVVENRLYPPLPNLPLGVLQELFIHLQLLTKGGLAKTTPPLNLPFELNLPPSSRTHVTKKPSIATRLYFVRSLHCSRMANLIIATASQCF